MHRQEVGHIRINRLTAHPFLAHGNGSGFNGIGEGQHKIAVIIWNFFHVPIGIVMINGNIRFTTDNVFPIIIPHIPLGKDQLTVFVDLEAGLNFIAALVIGNTGALGIRNDFADRPAVGDTVRGRLAVIHHLFSGDFNGIEIYRGTACAAGGFRSDIEVSVFVGICTLRHGSGRIGRLCFHLEGEFFIGIGARHNLLYRHLQFQLLVLLNIGVGYGVGEKIFLSGFVFFQLHHIIGIDVGFINFIFNFYLLAVFQTIFGQIFPDMGPVIAAVERYNVLAVAGPFTIDEQHRLRAGRPGIGHGIAVMIPYLFHLHSHGSFRIGKDGYSGRTVVPIGNGSGQGTITVFRNGNGSGEFRFIIDHGFIVTLDFLHQVGIGTCLLVGDFGERYVTGHVLHRFQFFLLAVHHFVQFKAVIAAGYIGRTVQRLFGSQLHRDRSVLDFVRNGIAIIYLCRLVGLHRHGIHRFIQLIAFRRRDFLHIPGAYGNVFQCRNTVFIRSGHLGHQVLAAVIGIYAEHSTAELLAAVLSIRLGQGDGAAHRLDVDHGAVDILVPVTPGELHGIAQIGPEILGAGYYDFITGGGFGFLHPVLTAGHQRSFRIAVFVRHHNGNHLGAVIIGIDGEFRTGQRLGTIGVKLTPFILGGFHLFDVHNGALEVGEIAVLAVALGLDRLVLHHGHFHGVLHGDLIVLRCLDFFHIIGASHDHFGRGGTVIPRGHFCHQVLAFLIGIDAELGAGQGIAVIAVHLLQGDLTAGHGVGHHKAVILVPGIGHIEIGKNRGFFHRIGNFAAVFILDEQLIKAGFPIVCTAEHNRLAVHSHIVGLQLHGHFRQAFQGRQALPFLFHGNGSVIIGIGDGEAVFHAAGNRGQIPGHHSRFLHGVGVGIAVCILAGQLGEFALPVVIGSQFHRAAVHGRIVLE